jgi:hypothetical protein
MAFEHNYHLEYFAIEHFAIDNYYWKQVDGESVICDEAEFPLSAPCACARALQDW